MTFAQFRHRYFRDKWAAAGSLLQFFLACVLILWFLVYVPWLMAHDIEVLYDGYQFSGVAPEWAKSFSVNHGSFRFYPDTPGENKLKLVAVLLTLAILVSCGRFVNKRCRQRNDMNEMM